VRDRHVLVDVRGKLVRKPNPFARLPSGGRVICVRKVRLGWSAPSGRRCAWHRVVVARSVLWQSRWSRRSTLCDAVEVVGRVNGLSPRCLHRADAWWHSSDRSGPGRWWRGGRLDSDGQDTQSVLFSRDGRVNGSVTGDTSSCSGSCWCRAMYRSRSGER
jgi:hypothetical protein